MAPRLYGKLCIADVILTELVSQTLSALLTLVLVFLMYPEVQKKAHEEMDRVVGGDRFPDFSDQESMPYLAAVCKEVC